MSTFVGTKEVKLEQFIAYPPIFCQRNEKAHAKVLAPAIKNSNEPTLLEVHLFMYPDGEIVIGNGNTRKEIWSNPGKYFVACPTHVRANLYSVKDDEDAKKLYYTLDSLTSVERNAHKLQGAYRAFDLYLKFPKLASGNGASGFQAALSTCPLLSNKEKKDPMIFVEFLQEELIVLDGLKWATSGSVKGFRPAFLAACIMLLKKYGVDNNKLIAGLNKLVSNTGGGTDSTNPIDKILNIWQMGGDRNVPDVKGNGGSALPTQLDCILYCFDKYMDGRKVTRLGSGWEGTYSRFWNYLVFPVDM